MAMSESYHLKSLNHSLDIIEVLAERGPEMGVSEIGKAIGLSKGAVHRILSNLSARGYVEPADGGKYRLGLRLWEMGLKVPGQWGLRDVASPRLHELMDLVHESVLLVIYDHGEVVYLDKAASDQAVQTYSQIGGRAPAHTVASGKAMLANQPQQEQDRVLAGALTALTKNTITDPHRLAEALAKIRLQGYAVNIGERQEDVNGVAAVIKNATGRPVGAISISGPAFRFGSEQIANAVEPLLFTAQSITKQLGYTSA